MASMPAPAPEDLKDDRFGEQPPEPFLNNPCYLEAKRIAKELGLPVIPIHDKKPRFKRWPKATTDPDEIERQFRESGDFTGVGIVTGNGIVGVDEDVDKGGRESAIALQEKYGMFPKTLTVITGGAEGNNHKYFKIDQTLHKASALTRSYPPLLTKTDPPILN